MKPLSLSPLCPLANLASGTSSVQNKYLFNERSVTEWIRFSSQSSCYLHNWPLHGTLISGQGRNAPRNSFGWRFVSLLILNNCHVGKTKHRENFFLRKNKDIFNDGIFTTWEAVSLLPFELAGCKTEAKSWRSILDKLNEILNTPLKGLFLPLSLKGNCVLWF